MTEEVFEPLGPEEERHTAIHEAGHAVATVVLGLGLLDVSIGTFRDRRTGILAGGVFHWDSPTPDTLFGRPDRAIPMIAMYVAGPVAERRINPNTIDPNRSEDFRVALGLAATAAGEVVDLGNGTVQTRTTRKDQMDLYSKGLEAAQALVTEHWPTIEALADLLQTRRAMTGAEVAEFIRGRGHEPGLPGSPA